MNINYYKRILAAYLINKKKSNLSFWHTKLKINRRENIDQLANYYLDYTPKTLYPGPFDKKEVPMLNYFGNIGIQYNPDAIAQYAIGYFEKYLKNRDNAYKEIFLKQADWFVNNLRERDNDIGVWEYNFDFEYFKKIKKPWYTSLGQGHGISVLVRAYLLTKKAIYIDTAKKAFLSFKYPIDVNGGVKYIDENGCVWFEEVIMKPSTHILNGFIWALWGIYDYWLATKDVIAKNLFDEGVKTLKKNLYRYDNGFWSTYDLAKTKLRGIASWYYHNLHIVQLKVIYKLTNEKIFLEYSEKWEKYQKNFFFRTLAFVYKAIFKVFYY